MKTINYLVFYLIILNLFSIINNLNLKNKLKNKWIHEVNKEAKGHSTGTNLLHMMNVTKAMIRPQPWYFDVSAEKPIYKYIREAEEEGLKYQIIREREELDRLERNIKFDANEKRYEISENKLIGHNFNAYRTKSVITPDKHQIQLVSPQIQIS